MRGVSLQHAFKVFGCAALIVLLAQCGDGGAQEGQHPCDSDAVHAEDATSHTSPVVYSVDIFACWKRPGDKNQITAKEAWLGCNANVKQKGNNIRLYAATWEN